MKQLLSIVAIIFCFFDTTASHLKGGEITWECLGASAGANAGKYIFQLKLYRDCNGITLTPGTQPIKVANNPSIANINCLNVAVNDLTPPGCSGPTGAYTCANPQGLLGATQEFVYRSLPVSLGTGVPPAQGWVFYWGEICCRNLSDNVTCCGQMLLRSKMFSYNGQPASPCFDSSPYFAERPTSFICIGYQFNYNNAAFDTDLDSLRYGWDFAFDGNTWASAVSLPYQVPYSITNPLPGNPVLNPDNGQLTITTVIGGAPSGNFVTVVRVESYRCNQKIAEIYREIQVSLNTSCQILPGGANNPPGINPAPFPDPITGLYTSYKKTVFAGDTVAFNLIISDYDLKLDFSFQKATLDPVSSEFASNYATSPPSNCDRPPCAYFTDTTAPYPVLIPPIATNPPVPFKPIRFFWPTNCSHRGGGTALNCATNSNTYYFVLRLKDDMCPIPAINAQTVSIVVVEPPKFLPPRLKCASVNNSGSVSLTWAPPTLVDTFGSFYSYEIYRSLSGLPGTFSILDSNMVLSDTTYTDFSINAQLASYHYYVVTKCGCDSNKYSDNSDTLHSMLLTGTMLAGNNVQLNWNPLHTPPLSTSHSKYIISRWRKSGIGGFGWINIDSISTLLPTTYTDVSLGTFCSDSITYRIYLADDSLGCTSISSYKTFDLQVIIPPKPPEIKTISAIYPSGIKLSWQPPAPVDTSLDFGGYYIYASTTGPGGVYNLVDSVLNNYTATTKTVTGLTAYNSGPIYFYMKTKEDCAGSYSIPSDTVTAIILTVTQVLNNATLTWNNTRTPIISTSGQYEIFKESLPAGSGIWNLVASVPNNINFYNDPVTVCNDSINYLVRINVTAPAPFVRDSSISIKSGRKLTTAAPIIEAPSLRCLAVDPLNGSVTLNWKKPTGVSNYFDVYLIYRAANLAGPYVAVGSVSNYNTPTYIDGSVNAITQPYYYNVVARAGCNAVNLFYSLQGDTLSTIKLAASGANFGFADLSWNSIGPFPLGTVGGYNVERSLAVGGPWTFRGSTLATTYRDTIVQCNIRYYYRVTLNNENPLFCQSISAIGDSMFTSLGNIVAAPSMRCVEVLANGNIKLTWDTTGIDFLHFAKYMIYRDNVLIDSISSNLVLSYTDAGTNGNVASHNYYIRTKAGCSGQLLGLQSATLNSLFLSTVNTNVNLNPGTANLTWNNLTTTGLLPATSFGFYDVWSDYRNIITPNTIQDIANANASPYAEPITDCDTILTHQITVSDNSGCISKSNLVTKNFTYLGNLVAAPSLRCVEVLPSGNIKISWDTTGINFRHFNRYLIYRDNILIDSLNTSTSVNYTDIGVNGNTASHAYYIATKSGCTGQIVSSPSVTLNSLFLTTVNNNVNINPASAELTWNNLAATVILPPTSLGYYDVWSDYHNIVSPNTIKDIANSLATFFSEPVTNCDTILTHQITVSDNSGCISKSNLVTKNFTYLGNLVAAPSLRCVEVLPSGNIKISWDTAGLNFINFNRYLIYRDNILIDSLNTTASLNYTDIGVNGNTASHFYFIASKSGCTGQAISAPSVTLNSLFLTTVNNNVNLNPALAVLTWNNFTATGTLPITSLNYYDVWSDYRNIITPNTIQDIANANVSPYSEPVNDCDTILSHLITVTDNSGCVSKSNLVTKNFTYLGNLVSAPSLRCVEVLPSGNIKLSWDTAGLNFRHFNRYLIYRDNILIDSLNTTASLNYTDIGVNGNTASHFYFIATKSGCTGQAISAPSVTLNSLFLTTVNNNVNLNPATALLTWNNLTTTGTLPVTSLNYYDVWSDYRNIITPNTIQDIDNANASPYSESVNDCDTILTHQITVTDNSGCISKSNLVSKNFTYLGNVVAPPSLRCVEVLPSGNIKISWDTAGLNFIDFNQYMVYRDNALIDSINSSTALNYTDAAINGNLGSHFYYVRIKSGCSGQELGNPSVTLNSLFLATVNNNINLNPATALLTWNNLTTTGTLPVTSVNYYDVWSDYHNIVTPNTIQDIDNANASPYSELVNDCDTILTHQITVTDNSGCVSKSNLATKSFSYLGNVVAPPSLRCVEVLPSGNIKISWDTAGLNFIDFNQYMVYRDNALIDSVNSSTALNYTDAAINGNLGSHFYYVRIKSGCSGQELGNPSVTLRSIYLTTTNTNVNSNPAKAELLWNHLTSSVTLPGTSLGHYDVWSDYNNALNTIQDIDDVTDTIYSEDVTDCDTILSHQITVTDNAGCISKSNQVTKNFTYLGNVVAAPSVRCLSVQQPSGAIKVEWIPNSTTSFIDFNSYNIYRDNNVFLTSVNSSLAGSYIDASVSGNSASHSYYMITNSGCTGTVPSNDSNIVKSIKLTVTDSVLTKAILNWNNVHNGVNTNYSIYKEYPAGIWNILTTGVNDTTYSEYITLCDAFISYRVEQFDAAGSCTSVSSVSGHAFADVSAPKAPVIESVSVDPNDNSTVTIKWTASANPDVVFYKIYLQNSFLSYDSIGTVAAPLLSFVSQNPIVLNSRQSYRVLAEDSCGNKSPLSTAHNTLHSSAAMDICRSAIDASFDFLYQNMPGGIKQYDVYGSVNGGAYVQLSSIGSSASVYSDTNLVAGSIYCYYFDAIGNSGYEATSNSSCDTAKLLTLPKFSYLNKVSVVDVRRVIIEAMVDTADNVDISRFKIQRSLNSTGPFYTLGVVGYSQEPRFSYLDNTAQTDDNSYYYRVITVDSCGNDVLYSNLGRTILLSGRPEYNLTNYLAWNDYEDWLGKLKNFSIFRKVDNVWNNTVPIFSPLFGRNDYFDNVSEIYQTTGKFCYVIAAYEGPGNAYGFADTSYSNEFCMIQEPHLFVPSAFTPGGFNPIFKPEFIYINAKNYKFLVFNRWGQKVYETENPSEGWNGTVDGKVAPEDTYVYSVRIFGTNGEQLSKSGRVTLLR